MKYFFAIILSLIIASSSGAQSVNTTNNINDEEGIKKVLINFVDAWNKHDAKIFSNVFSTDADFTNVFGKGASSRTEIEKFHALVFSTKFKDSYQQINKSKIRLIKPDVAAVDAWWELTGIKGPEGQVMPPRKGLLNFVMTKNNEIWLITVMHNMDLPVSN
jgi:uncharacterized protein (TIGR02246 family)